MESRRESERAPVVERCILVEFSPSGGLFQFAYQLGQALGERGHDVRLLTGRGPELPATDFLRIVEALPTWHAGASISLPAWLRKARRVGRAGLYALAWLRVLEVQVRAPADVIMVSAVRYPLDALFLAVARLLFRRCRLVLVAHEPRSLAEHSKAGSLYRQGLLSRVTHGLAYRAVHLVLVLGPSSRAALAETAPRLRNVGEIPHGNEEALLQREPSDIRCTPPVVLFFGTWTRSKGLDLLLDAFPLVRARVPDALLHIAGSPGPDVDLDDLRRRAADVEGVVLRPGYVPVDDVGPLLDGARLVALPYRRAAQSGVLHLAQTFARPVVATAVGDIPEAIGSGGVLVPPDDSRALAEALVRVLLDVELAAALGAAGRRRATGAASWAEVAGMVEKHLRRSAGSQVGASRT